jgi:DNA-directed RNA polymerase I and III subunit RPAC2
MLILMADDSPDVDFCGYTIPHPSEPKMHVRLQTRQGACRAVALTLITASWMLTVLVRLVPCFHDAGVPSDDVLRNGLTDLRKVSSAISDAYRKELKAFNRKARKN